MKGVSTSKVSVQTWIHISQKSSRFSKHMKVNEDYLTEEKYMLREGEEREQYNFLPAPLIYHSSFRLYMARQYML